MESSQTAISNAVPPQLASLSVWKRFGTAGFLFFLIKGLLWLLAPVVLYLLS